MEYLLVKANDQLSPHTCHGEDADEETDGASGQHDLLLGVIARWLLARCPDPHRQDQHVEYDDRDHTPYVYHLD